MDVLRELDTTSEVGPCSFSICIMYLLIIHFHWIFTENSLRGRFGWSVSWVNQVKPLTDQILFGLWCSKKIKQFTTTPFPMIMFGGKCSFWSWSFITQFLVVPSSSFNEQTTKIVQYSHHMDRSGKDSWVFLVPANIKLKFKPIFFGIFYWKLLSQNHGPYSTIHLL